MPRKSRATVTIDPGIRRDRMESLDGKPGAADGLVRLTVS
jgi:hypothetical protein